MRINELTQALTYEENDFIAIDNGTNGTRKIHRNHFLGSLNDLRVVNITQTGEPYAILKANASKLSGLCTGVLNCNGFATYIGGMLSDKYGSFIVNYYENVYCVSVVDGVWKYHVISKDAGTTF